ncbi:MAG: FKBP-type peptidyl-prolyl cis-trans isomerase [Acidobacteriota bacterium]
MKSRVLLFLLASSVAYAQTGAAAKPATPGARTPAAHRATAAKPAGELPAIHGVVRTMFSERYEDYKIGAGALAEPNKLYKVLYTGYLAATGQKFDSTDDHRAPEMKDGKPVTGPDGKAVMGPVQPLIFPQGFGRLIPGFDQGFTGMHVGGKRRIFIPWELGYGTRDIPAHGPDHPGIPPKSNLIFDVELVEMTDMPKPPQRPFGGAVPHPGGLPARPAPPAEPVKPATAPAAAAPAASAEPAAKPAQPDANPQPK